MDEDATKLVERLQAAQDATGLGIYDYDVPADRIFWDARIRELWGVAPNEPVSYATFESGLHPDDHAHVNAAVAASFDPAGSGHYAAEYRVISRRDGITRRISATGRTTFVDGKPVRLVGTVRDVTDLRAEQEAAAAAERFAQNLIATAPTMVYIYSLAEQRNLYITPQARAAIGLSQSDAADLDGELMRTIMHTDDQHRVSAHHAKLRLARHDGPFAIEYRMRHVDGTWHWYASQDIVHARNAAGEVTEILGAALDITHRHQLHEQREMLMLELNHRVKNIVSVVQAIASMTLRRDCDVSAWKAFEQRIQAMSRAQDELVHGGWESVDLGTLLRRTLNPYLREEARLRIEGPTVSLPSRDAVNVAMAVHELATNAVKYGALSNDAGSVTLTWQMPMDRIELRWSEAGGPHVSPPTHKGFGLNVINMADCNRQADIRFDPDGVKVALAILPDHVGQGIAV